MAIDEPAATNGVPAGWVVISSSHEDGEDKPSVSESAFLQGRRSAATSGQPEEGPSDVADWFEKKLRPMLEQVASPKTISDVAALLVPDAAGVVVGARGAMRGAGAVSETVGKGMEALGQSRLLRHLSGWTAAGTAAHGDIGKAAMLGAASPTLEYGGKGLQVLGQELSRAGMRPADAAAQAAAEAGAARPAVESPRALTERLRAENAAKYAAPEAAPAAAAPAAAPPPVTIEPPVAAGNNVASPAAKAAVPVIRNMTTEQFQAVSKLPVEERQLYIRLRQVGDSHAEAIRTLDYTRETQALREQAQTARAMVGKEKAASDLFGSSSPEAQQKLLELAPGPSRRPLAGEVAGLDARFKAMLADPKAAYILPFLGGTLGAAARRERGAE